MRVLGIEITDDYHSARLDKRARKTIQRHGPRPIMNMNIKPCSFHTDTMDILCQFPNDFLSWRYRYRLSSSPWVWYIINVNGSLWKHCYINLQLHPQACEKFSRTFKGLFRKTFILVYQRKNALANQKCWRNVELARKLISNNCDNSRAVQNCCKSPAAMFQVSGCLSSVRNQRPPSSAFIAKIWSLHQMDSWWPST